MPKEGSLFMYKTEQQCYLENVTYFNVEKREYLNNIPDPPHLHWHDFFEIEFFCGGRATHILNGETIHVKKGTIHLITPADFHNLDIDKDYGALKYFNINFNEYALSHEILKMLSEYDFTMCAELAGEEYDEMLREFEKLNEEFISDDSYRGLMVRNIFEKILLLFLRALIKKNVGIVGSKPKKDSNVQYIVSYLRLHFRESVSLKKMAKEIHLTPNYIGEIFKKETGMSFTDYVQRLRLNYATNLLVSSDFSIADISIQAGFNSVSYFIRTFRLVNGKTPLEYRNNIVAKSGTEENK